MAKRICPGCNQSVRLKSGIHKSCVEKQAAGARVCRGCNKPTRLKSGVHKGCADRTEVTRNSEGQVICPGCKRPTRLKSGWHKSCQVVLESLRVREIVHVNVPDDIPMMLSRAAFGGVCPIKSGLTAEYKTITVEFDDDCPTSIPCLDMEATLAVKPPTTDPSDSFGWPVDMAVSARRKMVERGIIEEYVISAVSVVRVDSPCYNCTRDGRESIAELQSTGKGVSRSLLGNVDAQEREAKLDKRIKRQVVKRKRN